MSLLRPVGNATEWRAAMRRATVHGVNRLEHVFTCDNEPGVAETFHRVKSATRDGEHYAVRSYDRPDGHYIKCTCDGWYNGRRCWHAAAALMMAGVISPTMAAAELAAA